MSRRIHKWLTAAVATSSSVLFTQFLNTEAQSQGQQDGVIRSILTAIGETNRYYVEIGFNSFTHQGGSGSNTYALYERGWKGLLLDGFFENPEINLQKEFVTSLNVVDLFRKYQVPLEPDYVSIGQYKKMRACT